MAISADLQVSPILLRPSNVEELLAGLNHHHEVMRQTKHLGEALLLEGLVKPEVLQKALTHQARRRASGDRNADTMLGHILVQNGILTESQLQSAIAAWLGEPVIDPQLLTPDPKAVALVPRRVAERESVLPLALQDDALVVLMANPWDLQLIGELRFLTQRKIIPAVAKAGMLLPAIDRAYHGIEASPGLAGSGAIPWEGAQPMRVVKAPETPGTARALTDELALTPESDEPSTEELVASADNTLVRMLNALIREALSHRASDIHIETRPPPQNIRIRLRVDGALEDYLEVPCRWRHALVTRLKIMAGLDISEHRKPQDGKIDFSRFGSTHLEMRLVTVPTAEGLEDIVLRLLGNRPPLPLDDIGLHPDNLHLLRRICNKSYGLILVCGPTGSGKTTTLHSLIHDINTPDRKIWTAEDPIEITQQGLRQVQMNSRIGWTFAAAMRTFLRADPDVIMIGEMRDEETARIAVEASLTGHLVLSTLHTNSAPESVSRLLEMGIDPFNFSDSLLGVLAQRLVRRLCPHCRIEGVASLEQLKSLAQYSLGSAETSPQEQERRVNEVLAGWFSRHGGSDGHIHLYKAREGGCEHCEKHGYLGRLGVHELMLNDDKIKGLINRRASGSEMRLAALAAGMRTLRQDGIEKVLQGLTDIGEVLLATNI
ncbi:MAG: type II/IV secretion system protein [Curvibacter sp.]|nr:type II/IV secretion system protein [Curvibacter sp.]